MYRSKLCAALLTAAVAGGPLFAIPIVSEAMSDSAGPSAVHVASGPDPEDDGADIRAFHAKPAPSAPSRDWALLRNRADSARSEL